MKLSPAGCTVILLSGILLTACVRPAPNTQPWQAEQAATLPAALGGQGAQALIPTQRPADVAYLTPTPDAAHVLPTLRTNSAQYVVQSGDSLASIASTYNLDVNTLAAANSISASGWLQVGQVLAIPALIPSVQPSDFKIIPDSELVNGPVSSTLDIAAFIQNQGGYLSHYTQIVDETEMSGSTIISTLSAEYSVSPRLLLALLEYQSGWLTQTNIGEQAVTYPMGLVDTNYQGLYLQVSWAANQLNRGFYLWQVGALASTPLADGNLVTFPATLNAGAVAIQRLLALVKNKGDWSNAVSENGFYATFSKSFGIPFDLAVEPLLPANLSQPAMQLPFESGQAWSFTGGPHSAWGTGSAWAALDFAPPADTYGCYSTDVWEVAVADGLIVRSENGEVVEDLDGDGLEQTGWTVLYMHVESRNRVAVGTSVKAGDRIGHPSCEGGFSNGTHLHLARRYNGEWIAADGNLPFVLDGWTSQGSGVEYDGILARGGQTITAWDGRIDENQIQR